MSARRWSSEQLSRFNADIEWERQIEADRKQVARLNAEYLAERERWKQRSAKSRRRASKLTLRLRRPDPYLYPPLLLFHASQGEVIGLGSRVLWPRMSALDALEAEFPERIP